MDIKMKRKKEGPLSYPFDQFPVFFPHSSQRSLLSQSSVFSLPHIPLFYPGKDQYGWALSQLLFYNRACASKGKGKRSLLLFTRRGEGGAITAPPPQGAVRGSGKLKRKQTSVTLLGEARLPWRLNTLRASGQSSAVERVHGTHRVFPQLVRFGAVRGAAAFDDNFP